MTLQKTPTPAIEFRHVVKRFPGAEWPTLQGMDLQVLPQQIHVLLGFSGAGKSVTLKHALGLEHPDAGDVLVKGVIVNQQSEYNLRELRKSFGMLFQDAALFDSLDVYENVAFPLREHRPHMSEAEIEKRVKELLGMVELEGALRKTPSELSGGMRKRVGLARAIALEPEILLFDEPTTGLDPVTSQIIDNLIVKTTRSLNAAALIVSHDVHAALRIGDCVSMIWQGKILETGAPSDFVKSQNPRIRQFLQSAGVL